MNLAALFHRGSGVSRRNYNIGWGGPTQTTIYWSCAAIKLLFQKLGIPVGSVDGIKERHPLFVAGQTEGFLHERRPLWLYRLSGQNHSRLLGCSTPFSAVTFVAGADHVLPNGCASLGARDYMVEIQFLAWKSAAAILARAFIPGVNIIAAEADLALGHSIVAYQQNYPRNANDAV